MTGHVSELEQAAFGSEMTALRDELVEHLERGNEDLGKLKRFQVPAVQMMMLSEAERALLCDMTLAMSAMMCLLDKILEDQDIDQETTVLSAGGLDATAKEITELGMHIMQKASRYYQVVGEKPHELGGVRKKI